MSMSGSNYKGFDRAFCIRMKSTLTKRGCHFKSSGYRVSVDANHRKFIRTLQLWFFHPLSGRLAAVQTSTPAECESLEEVTDKSAGIDCIGCRPATAINKWDPSRVRHVCDSSQFRLSNRSLWTKVRRKKLKIPVEWENKFSLHLSSSSVGSLRCWIMRQMNSLARVCIHCVTPRMLSC